VIAERFFDESGGMQLVVHAPLGGRINRAWGLALRKRFCRTFDFELQAAATDDGIVISLGEQHSFPLETSSASCAPTAEEPRSSRRLLDLADVRGPLALERDPRARGAALLGGKQGGAASSACAPRTCSRGVPGAGGACRRTTAGEIRSIPDHPLVNETIAQLPGRGDGPRGLEDVVARIESRRDPHRRVDTVEPSPLSHEILNANPYAFLDDAPLEERRARAVSLRRVRAPEARRAGRRRARPRGDRRATPVRGTGPGPTARDADELHDALLHSGGCAARSNPRRQRTSCDSSRDGSTRVRARGSTAWMDCCK
jgi:ATP-dependent helicase Lhr and Lhr-like helicase